MSSPKMQPLPYFFLLCSDLNKTKMMYVIQTDLKGKIPHYLIDSTLPSVQVSFYGNCRKAIKDKLLEKMNS